jgi:hypothetical protein
MPDLVLRDPCPLQKRPHKMFRPRRASREIMSAANEICDKNPTRISPWCATDHFVKQVVAATTLNFLSYTTCPNPNLVTIRHKFESYLAMDKNALGSDTPRLHDHGRFSPRNFHKSQSLQLPLKFEIPSESNRNCDWHGAPPLSSLRLTSIKAGIDNAPKTNKGQAL